MIVFPGLYHCSEMDPKSVTIMDIVPAIDPADIGLSSSDKVNPVLSTKPRKKTMTSVYLKYFETAADGKSRRCKFCGQSYSIATATGNLILLALALFLLPEFLRSYYYGLAQMLLYWTMAELDYHWSDP